ncbi:MAG: hypothetical protein KAQ78_02785, partial [Candidatus Latescibacteria bacterium]|nr:hypothetical protein [Candidatus Latescibacterota bacterium]
VEITTPVAVANNGSVEIVFASAAGLTNPTTAGSYTLQASTSQEATPVASNTYSIAVSTVTAASVTPNPLQQSLTAQYEIAFNVGIQGALTAGSSTITVAFPNDTSIPSSMAASEVQVNDMYLSIAPTTDSGARTVTLTTPVSVADNESVTVLFFEDAGLVNPTTAGAYALDVKTSVETTDVPSNSYTISSTSSISTPIYTSTDYNSGTIAEDTVSFDINLDIEGRSQQKMADYIQVQFPQGTTVPGSIATSTIRLESADGSKSYTPFAVEVSEQTVAAYLYSGNSLLASSDNPIRIRFLTGAGIGNPSTAQSSYTVKASTRKEPDLITSDPYIIVSTTPLTSATVTPNPNTTNTEAAYTIGFVTGSNGALAVGDTITVQFPSGTTVPASLSKSSVKVNSVACTVTPVVSAGDRRVQVISPVAVNAGSSVDLSFTLAAGIMNPDTGGTDYQLGDLHTTIQPNPNATPSGTYEIVQSTDVTAANVTPDPSTTGLTAQVALRFAMGSTGLGSGDAITVTFPSGTTVPSSISSGNVTVTDDGTPITVSGASTTPVSREVRITVGEGVDGRSSMGITFLSTAGIRNPTTSGNSYTLDVAATGNGSAVSNVYEITQSTVTSATVTPDPSTQNNTAEYTIAFNVGSGGALSAGSNTITIQFPSGATIPSSMAAGEVTVNGTVLSV